MPMAAALTVAHALIPPHPAPAAAAQLLGADLGKSILYGIALTIPTIILGGIGYGGFMARRLFLAPAAMADIPALQQNGLQKPPAVPVVLLLLLLPVLLIFSATLADLWKMPARGLFDFVGHPFTALLIATLAAMALLGLGRGLGREAVLKLSTESLLPVGTLLVIMGGGGAFKQVIVDSGVGSYAGRLLAASSVSPLLLAFAIAVALRAAQGSATVAIVTAAGIVAPLVKGIQGVRPEVLVLALCCGGTSLSHVNDAGFWLVKEYFGMSVAQTLRTWTVMKTIMSIVGIGLVLLLQRWIG
jgi:GntP family gluconate:H+ symporter